MELTTRTAWQRAQEQGLRGVGHQDLLALVVSRDERDVEANEREVAEQFKGWTLPQLGDIALSDIHGPFGLDGFEAFRVLAAIELGRRIGLAAHGERPVEVSNSREAYELFKHLAGESQEHFAAAFFDSKAKLIARKTIHVGTLNMSVVGAREVFREAVRLGAAVLIVGHNHPSGDPTPSPEDIAVTKRLQEVGELLDVPLLDHVIVGHNGRFTSLSEQGVL